MMNKIKPSIFLEVVWFLTFLMCLGLAIRITYTESFTTSILYYLMSLASLAMFLFRRHMRKKS